MRVRRRARRAGQPRTRRQVSRTSCSPTRTSRPRRTGSSRACSPRPARRAWPGRGCWSSATVYDELVERVAARGRRDAARGSAAGPGHEMGPVAFRSIWIRCSASSSGPRRGRAAGQRRRAPLTPELEGRLLRRADAVRRRRQRMGIAREEVFGPVAGGDPFDDEDEALRIANDTAYGLAAGIWTTNVQRAHRMAQGVRAGTIWINSYRAVGPMAPFGGFKTSGLGRENGMGSDAGVHGVKDGLGRAQRSQPGSVQARLSLLACATRPGGDRSGVRRRRCGGRSGYARLPTERIPAVSSPARLTRSAAWPGGRFSASVARVLARRVGRVPDTHLGRATAGVPPRRTRGPAVCPGVVITDTPGSTSASPSSSSNCASMKPNH